MSSILAAKAAGIEAEHDMNRGEAMGMTQTFVEMAAAFVVAQLRFGPSPPEVVDAILYGTHATLLALSRQEAAQKRQTDEKLSSETLVSLRQRPWTALQRSQVICLECGKVQQILSNSHLALHGLTAKAYKKKWGIPLRRPLSAHSLTQRRRRKAKKRHAGQYLAAWRARQRQRTE
jgi:predicted transcriptional regulator